MFIFLEYSSVLFLKFPEVSPMCASYFVDSCFGCCHLFLNKFFSRNGTVLLLHTWVGQTFVFSFRLHLSHKNVVCFCSIMVQFELATHKLTNQTTLICQAFKSHIESSNALHVSAPTTMIQMATLVTIPRFELIRSNDMRVTNLLEPK